MYSKQERKNIKSTLSLEETRRKREEKLSGLRKKKKDELLKKKRKQGTVTKLDPQVIQKLQNLPKLVEQLQSNDTNQQLEATIAFRRLLSMGK